MELLNDPSFSILKAAVTRAGLSAALSDKNLMFTVFAPDDAAFNALGITAPAIGALRPGYLDTILRFHVIGGQEYKAAGISTQFPNMYMQSMLMLVAPMAQLPPGYRMPLFVNKNASGVFADTVPVKQADMDAANGVVHKIRSVLIPPAYPIWPMVNADPNFAYLKAAIQRADSGVAASETLQAALNNPLANLTVFAPTNQAFQEILTAAIYQALVRQGVPPAQALPAAQSLASTPAVFSNPALYGVLTAQVVQGIVVYHLLGARAFSVNLPAGSTSVPTAGGALLPPLQIRVTGALVETRGPGNVDFVPPNGPVWGKVIAPNNRFINGVVHVVDKVMLPIIL
jgi:uncharacterized surface protein with fasciclin (FAS1) repeats